MRRAKFCRGITLLAVCSWLPLAGCDNHDKAWDAPRDSAAGAKQPKSSEPDRPLEEIVVTVSHRGAITCKINGAFVLPARQDEAPGNEHERAVRHLLIVEDNVHERELCFPASLDLTSADFSSEGNVTVHHVRQNLVVEADGPAQVALYAPDPQDDIDACARYAAQGDIDRIAGRLNADPALVDGRNSKQGRTPLAMATEAGRLRTVDYLLDRKAGTDIRDNRGFTALHLAVLRGRLDIVKRLVQSGADVNAKSAAGNTPMHLALDRGQTEIAAFLADAGASGNVPNRVGKTPMQLAIDKIFELTEQQPFGPFADGSTIKFADGRLYVMRSGQTDENRWEQFDLPGARETWISLQGTNYTVMVRGRGDYRVWARYRARNDQYAR